MERRYSFRVENEKLLLVYRSRDVHWALAKISDGAMLCGGCFLVFEGKLIGKVNDSLEEAEFLLGNLYGEYFVIDEKIAQTKNPVLIHRDAINKLNPGDFYVAQPYFDWGSGAVDFENPYSQNSKNIPLLPKIDSVSSQSLKIGGSDEDAIPIETFQQALKVFPDRREIRYYMDARIAQIVGEYLVPNRDYGARRDNLIEARIKKMDKANHERDLFAVTRERRIEVYTAALHELQDMLAKQNVYVEADWQKKILNIILLLYPKYILAEHSVRVKTDDGYKEVDIMLVDAGGFVDLVEIKKPEVGGVGVLRKALYRANYVPSRELAGTIMQVEKYVYWLARWGKSGEDALQKKYGVKLPHGVQIRVASPIGLIIFGRDTGFNLEQKKDFEIIRRKYKHVVEIMTYDDLQRRLQNILEMLKR